MSQSCQTERTGKKVGLRLTVNQKFSFYQSSRLVTGKLVTAESATSSPPTATPIGTAEVWQLIFGLYFAIVY